ncbi:MAG: glycosyltransferase family 87 protein [Candidatus Firestonebacteria bacterium]
MFFMLKELTELTRKKSTFWFGLFFFVNIIYALTRHSVDFYQFWLISRNAIFVKGYDIYYVNTDFSQPLFFFCFVTAFSVFTYKTALFLWNIMQIFLAAFTIILSSKILGFGERYDGGWNEGKHLKSGNYVLPLILGAVIICDNLWLGQANILSFFLCTAAIYNHLKERSWAVGLLLALAISVKLTPILFLIYFLYKKDYEAFPWTIGGVFLFMTVVPSMLYGIPKTLIYLQEYIRSVIMPFVNNDVVIRGTTGFWHSNQSIDGFLGRHFTDFGRNHYGGFHNMIDPANMTLLQIKKIGLIIKTALVLLAAFAFTNNKKKNPHLLKFEYAIMFLLILFISPASWLNHFVTVIFGYYVAANYIRDDSSSYFGRILMKIGLIACFTLATLSSFTKYTQSFSGMFLGHFILLISLFIILFIEKSRIRKT